MERPWYYRFNWFLAIAAVTLAVFGVVVIQSANLHDPTGANEWRRQMFYIFAGIGILALCAWIDYRRWQRWALALYVLNLVLLIIVFKGGHSALGAQRWISLGPLGTFQPSEPAKLILAIVIATRLARNPIAGPRELLFTLAAVAPAAFLILKQPDMGTTLTILAFLSAQLFFGVTRLTYFGYYAFGSAVAAALVVGTNFVLKPFQRNRLLIFLHPNSDPQGAGWSLNQSKIAVGSGELFGKGPHHGTQTQLNFVPEHSRDFIFTVVGEELGYVGALSLVLAYAAVIGGALTAVFAARDRFGLLLAIGIVTMLAFHIVVNIGMTLGIMPITGIPLPFLSYGGSAILTDFAAIGVLLNIHMQKDKVVF